MTPAPVASAARERVLSLHAADAVAHEFGIAVLDVDAGRAVLTMTVTAAMTNGHGICHGGLIFTLADTAFAYACNSRDGTHVAAHAAIEFLMPARRGDLLRAEAVEQWNAGRSGLTDVRIYGPDGGLVALFHGRSRRVDAAPAG